MENRINTNEEAFNALEITTIPEMLGEVFSRVEQSEYELNFYTPDNRYVKFYHAQSCCESVEIEDICGDLNDLIGSPMLQAEEVSTCDYAISEIPVDESHTWTFYRFATVKGSVVVRWLGESNGYYSEEVDIDIKL